MKAYIPLSCALIISLSFSLHAKADDYDCPIVDSVVDGLDKKITDAKLSSNLTAQKNYQFILETIQSLRKQTRNDQDLMYAFAHSINMLIHELPDTGYSTLKAEVFKITSELIKADYNDAFFTNQNTSRLIKCRPVILLRDAEVISSATTRNQDREKFFIDELKELSDKYLSSKRYRIGLGASYSYIPLIGYSNITPIDLSTYEPLLGIGDNPDFLNPDRLVFNNIFSNKSYASLRLTAEIPLFSIDLLLSNAENSTTTEIPVRASSIGGGEGNLLQRSTVNSTMSIDYDVQVRMSVREVFIETRKILFNKNSPVLEKYNQIDGGFAIGTTGLNIKDSVSTEIKLRADSSQPWAELPAGITTSHTDERSFNVFYWSIYSTFDISDQLEVGLDVRFYSDESDGNADIHVDNKTVSFYITWFVL